MSIVIYPASQPAIQGIVFDPLPSTPAGCGVCVTGDVSYNITGRYNLTKAPPEGKLLLFVSNYDFQNWYYAGYWDGYVLGNDTSFKIDDLCLGAMLGKTWIVACHTSGFQDLVTGQSIDGPPFDNRCSVIGSICQPPCGVYVEPQSFCEDGIIPWADITSNISGGTQGISREHKDSPFLMTIVLMTLISIITQAVSAAPGFHKEEAHQPANIDQVYQSITNENRQITTRILLCAANENENIVTRGAISALHSLYHFGEVFREHGGSNKNRLVLQINEDNLDPSKRKFKNLPYNLKKFLNDDLKALKQLDEIGRKHPNFQNYHDSSADWTTNFQNAFEVFDLFQLWRNLISYKNSELDQLEDGYNQKNKKKNNNNNKNEDDRYNKENETKPVRDRITTNIWFNKIKIELEYTAPNTPEEKGKTKGLNHALALSKETAADDTDMKYSFLIINDARHAFKPKFLVHTIPKFWKTSIDNQTTYRDLAVRFVQVPQVFYAVHLQKDDFIDRQNGYYYFLMNTLRHCSRMVSSSGTNCVWSIHNHEDDNTEFNFGEKSVIEDTETSHIAFLHGEKSEYVKLVLATGTVKDTNNFVSAMMRWSAGAVHNFFLTMRWMWLFYTLSTGWVLGLFFMIFYLDNSQLFILGISLISVFAYLVGCYHSRTFQVRTIIFANTTYWLTGIISALWWMLIFPFCISMGVAQTEMNTPIAVFYGLVTFFVQWVITKIQIIWSNNMSKTKKNLSKDEKTNVSESHFLRAYQNWALLWSAHILAILLAVTKRWNAPTSFLYIVKFFVFVHISMLTVGVVYPFVQFYRGADFLSMVGGLFVNLVYLLVLFHPAVYFITGYNVEFSGRHLSFLFLFTVCAIWEFDTDADLMGFLFHLTTLLPDWQYLQRGCYIINNC
eukprot:TRINITY_DN5006_c0_g1_i1.p1 TRINITY_DN5006_c0_g1~~TRINITY_DN5006_c0_g1_i1.p1  ORF type:complete len:897 (+),score=171.17 TRINITY_DN5006_c0_g1_i1:193-2883(+)